MPRYEQPISIFRRIKQWMCKHHWVSTYTSEYTGINPDGTRANHYEYQVCTACDKSRKTPVEGW